MKLNHRLAWMGVWMVAGILLMILVDWKLGLFWYLGGFLRPEYTDEVGQQLNAFVEYEQKTK